MKHRWTATATLFFFLFMPIHAQASTGDVGSIIEEFVTKQFPLSDGHYWVISETQWDGDEMVIDLHTIVTERRQLEPRLDRFLLLIVAGELKGVQIVPLDPGTECRPEKDA